MTIRLAPACLLLAVTAPGVLSAQGFNYDFRPNVPEVVLDTDFAIVQTVQGPQIAVSGGVFVFRSVTIPAGVTVRAVGSNPLIFVVQQDFRVDGLLTGDGANGARVDTLNSANFPAPGGLGGPAAGAGGDGSPLWFDRSPTGQPGWGPLMIPGFGGGGGQLSCISSCNRGSGGGGGSFATQGDVDYLLGAQSWPQVFGNGGPGCLTQSLPGGAAGPRYFVDGRHDNDFWGVGYDVFARRFVQGELPTPLGGSGGGGGGDRSLRCIINDPAFVNDNKGGGGGGGGGALVVLALGQVIVGPSGVVSANGGHGGGGEQAGSNNQGGGGGGGGGGMIVLLGSRGIELHVKGETYVNAPDGDFVLSADGGIGTQGRFGGLEITEKYPIGSPTWNQKPTGGFGGLGLIELVARPGNNADGTNTVLDDNIQLYQNGQLLTGATKTRFLGWRGYLDPNGVWVDDFGNPTNVGKGYGDMRPDPVLLPLF